LVFLHCGDVGVEGISGNRFRGAASMTVEEPHASGILWLPLEANNSAHFTVTATNECRTLGVEASMNSPRDDGRGRRRRSDFLDVAQVQVDLECLRALNVPCLVFEGAFQVSDVHFV
jgi:hypothetical protein